MTIMLFYILFMWHVDNYCKSIACVLLNGPVAL